MAITIAELVAQLTKIDKVADKARRAAQLIRDIDAGVVVLGNAAKDDQDRALTLSEAEKDAIFARYINRAANLLDDAKARAAEIQTV